MRKLDDLQTDLRAVHERYIAHLGDLERQARAANARRIEEAKRMRDPERDIRALATAGADLSRALAAARALALAQRDADLLAHRARADAELSRLAARLAQLRAEVASAEAAHAEALAAALSTYRAVAKGYRTSTEALAMAHTYGAANVDKWLAPGVRPTAAATAAPMPAQV
jgi:chromosome segregation ATPase